MKLDIVMGYAKSMTVNSYEHIYDQWHHISLFLVFLNINNLTVGLEVWYYGDKSSTDFSLINFYIYQI